MGYSIDWSDLEQRIQDQKAALLDTSQNMDPERLKFLVETYDECKGESVFITRAKLFEKVLNNKKIYLDGNPIVGSLAGGRAMIYAYPEWQCNWVKDDLDSEKLALSSLGEVRFSDETKEILKKVYKTWKGKTTYDRANKLYKELYGGNAELLVKCGWIYPVNDNSTGSGVADYPAMLTKGIRGILEEVEAAYRALPKHATNWTKIEFYRACKIALNAVIAYAHRYADLAEETAKAENNPKKQAELMEIAEVCRRVPEFPARNFREALQSFWFTHCCIQIEQCGCGHSLGRYGQYMYPFYKKDLDEGTLTKEQVLTLLKCQWVKHLEIAVYQGDAYAKAFSGHTGQTISLGGYTADGDDASNDLEELLMDTQIAMNNIQPTLALFYTPKMKPSYLEKAAEVVRSGSGQPQFMNMNAAVARSLVRFASRGITLDEARTLPVIFGCVGTGIQGKGSYVTFEGQPNLAKLVEFAMYDGYDPHTRKQVFPNVKPAEECATFEELYDALLRHMDHAYDAQRKISDLGNSTREQIVPNIFRSCLLDGCIESGLCEEAGGPKYSQSLCITSTGIDAANSLYAIKHLIYDTKQLTWEQLKKALAANFEGYEDIQKLCFGAPKHGNDIEDVDQPPPLLPRRGAHLPLARPGLLRLRSPHGPLLPVLPQLLRPHDRRAPQRSPEGCGTDRCKRFRHAGHRCQRQYGADQVRRAGHRHRAQQLQPHEHEVPAFGSGRPERHPHAAEPDQDLLRPRRRPHPVQLRIFRNPVRRAGAPAELQEPRGPRRRVLLLLHPPVQGCAGRNHQAYGIPERLIPIPMEGSRQIAGGPFPTVAQG